MEKIKVLHVIKSLGRGGAEILLLESLKLHDQQKFEFHYIYFFKWNVQLDKAIEDAGGKVSCFHVNNNLSLLFQYKKIIKYCKTNTIDIVHCHLPWSGFIGRLVFKKIKIPVFYTEHSLLERYHPITKILNNYTYNFQTLAIGVSESVSSSIKRNTTTKIPIHTILNGINTLNYSFQNKKEEAILRKDLSIPEEAIIIGIVAAFKNEKRLHYWIDTLAACIDKNENIYGLLVGVDKKQEAILLKNRKDCHTDRIIFTGFRENVIPFYSIMDIFMMTSSYEGLPIALLEAMSMSCAIVTTDAGGIKEVIRDKKDGFIFPVDDWKKLASACLHLANNPNLLADYKDQAKNRVETSFKLADSVKKLEGLYLEYY